jgi:hypothetical protein
MKRKKWGRGSRKNVSKAEGMFRKFLNMRTHLENFKKLRGARLIYPIVRFFFQQKKKPDFSREKNENFQKVGVHSPPSVNAMSLLNTIHG